MVNNKQIVVNLVRRLRLLHLVDTLRYWVDAGKNWKRNQAFARLHPDDSFPPLALAYDAYGHSSWEAYYHSGLTHAAYLSEVMRTYMAAESLSICEWGCGPARILRHLPRFFTDRALSLSGFDYNARTIRWCQDHIRNVTFKLNTLAPPLDQESSSFDCLYCVSVFTHLSAEMHFAWIRELSRVVRPDGIIVLTTHGDLSQSHLLKPELQRYASGELVVRDKVAEGKRTFVAYHPPAFVRQQLLKELQVLAHIPDARAHGLSQDIWVVRNTKA
ncbi:MAG: class I SAM-dependent methyltransferase [Anaerolineales bacterium]|nr:class I SAM-dependent methyltransferase [Anaerolineales bacterium]